MFDNLADKLENLTAVVGTWVISNLQQNFNKDSNFLYELDKIYK